MFAARRAFLFASSIASGHMKEHEEGSPRRRSQLGFNELPHAEGAMGVLACAESLGVEISSNAASSFASESKVGQRGGVSGSASRSKALRVDVPKNGKLERQDVAFRNAMKLVRRDRYVKTVSARRQGEPLAKKQIRAHGAASSCAPSRRCQHFTGSFGRCFFYGTMAFGHAGNLLHARAVNAKRDEWLPSEADQASLRT